MATEAAPAVAPTPQPGYDRDKVKALEREIELESGNRFEGWNFAGGAVAETAQPSDERVFDPQVLIDALDKIQMTHDEKGLWLIAEQALEKSGAIFENGKWAARASLERKP